MSKAEIRRLLLKAADVVQERGLFKGDFCDPRRPDGPVCTVGALRVAALGSPLRLLGYELYEALSRPILAAIGFKHKDSDCQISTWNDHRRRRKCEVVAKLRQAAELV